MSDSVAPWTGGHQASLSITNSQSLLKLMSIKLVMCFPEAGPKTRIWVPAVYLEGDPSLGIWYEHGDKIVNMTSKLSRY